MRWSDPKTPKLRDFRERTGFLWWPKRINGETRWLERAQWTQRYQQYYGAYGDSRYQRWEDYYWEDDE
jgi:hypothetical protein